MKIGKRYLIEGMELPNQDWIRTLGEKEIFNYLGVLGLTPSNKWRWKIKSRMNSSEELENYTKQNYLAESLPKD